MAKYTTQVRTVCEVNAGLDESVGASSVDNVIALSREKIFDFEYPIFDPAYKSVIETKILKTHYTDEIGEETVGLWKLRLNSRLNNIMPYYNQLYQSALLEFDPFNDVNYTKSGNVKANNQKNGNENNTNENLMVDGRNVSNETSANGTQNTLRTGENSNSGTYNGKVNDTGKNTFDGTTKSTGSNKVAGTGTTTNDKTSNEKNRYSDTPQSTITNLAGDKYLTNARLLDGSEKTTTENETTTNGSTTDETTNKNTEDRSAETITLNSTADLTEYTDNDNTTSSTHGTNKTAYTGTVRNTGNVGKTLNETAVSTNDYLERVAGKTSSTSYSDLLQKYRETFINIDMLVLNELKDLFMLLW